MEKLDELKNVDLKTLSNEEVLKHVDDILSLEDEDLIIDYLFFAIDNFYDMNNNPENIELFFRNEKLKGYFETMIKNLSFFINNDKK